MRDSSHQAFPGAGRTARGLLLVLALAACGGERGDAPRARPDSPPASDPVAQGGSAAPPCTTPSPAVDPALLAGDVAWDSLTAWRRAAGVSFVTSSPDSSVAWVSLCRGCNRVKLRIVSEAKTYCNTTGSLHDSTRIAGVLVVEAGTATPPGWGHTFVRNDSILVFAHDTSGSARLAYRANGRVRMAPDGAWSFRYCDHVPTDRRPASRWRHAGTGRVVTLADSLDDDVGGPPGTYGWMACASGCCQFYIPPIVLPGDPDEDGAPATPPAGHGAGLAVGRGCLPVS